MACDGSLACKSTRQDKQTSRHDPPAGPADGERRSSLGLTCTKFLASQARSLNPVGRTREAHTRSLCALYAHVRNEISVGQVTSTRIRACHSEIKHFRCSISRLASSPWMILQSIGCIPTHFASHVSAIKRRRSFQCNSWVEWYVGDDFSSRKEKFGPRKDRTIETFSL